MFRSRSRGPAESGVKEVRRNPANENSKRILPIPAGDDGGNRRNRLRLLALRHHSLSSTKERPMRKSIIGLAAVAALFALPNIASATDSGAAAGAVTGGVAGAVFGVPFGAAIGAGAGAVAGGAATGPNTTGTVVIQERNPTSREQTCVQDAAGNRTCREVVR
jgi:hypothetical protein